jgi:aliphatic nitrilase
MADTDRPCGSGAGGIHSGTGPVATRLSVELFRNSVEIPGPEIEELPPAASDAGAYAVVGVCEKQPNTIGTLFNTQVFIGPDGSLLGKHQKLMPTVGERLGHTGGHGDTLDLSDDMISTPPG